MNYKSGQYKYQSPQLLEPQKLPPYVDITARQSHDEWDLIPMQTESAHLIHECGAYEDIWYAGK